MEGANRDLLRFSLIYQFADPGTHLVRGFVSESNSQDALGRSSLMEQVSDPHRDHPGFAGPSPSQNQERSLGAFYSRLLLGVEIEKASHTLPKRGTANK